MSWPAHIRVRPEQWPRAWAGRKRRYSYYDLGASPFLHIRGGASVRILVIGRVCGPDGWVHARRMGDLWPRQPYENHMGVHCGQLTRLRSIDFRYDLRVTCPNCIKTLDKIICSHRYS